MSRSKKPYARAYVEITNICNLSCSFCPGTKRPPRRMTEAEFTIICEELLPLTDYVYLHVMGEPLTHPELPKFIAHATERGLKCAVTTNGTLLGSRGGEIIDSGAYKVNVSLHSFELGQEEKHAAYLSNVADFADRASERGILTVLRLWNKGVDGGLNSRTLDYLKSRFDGEWAESDRGFRIRNKLHIEWGERFDWPDMKAADMGDCVFCYGLIDHFGILCDGRVVPCCLDREGEITLGRIGETPLAEILSSERATAIRNGFRCRRAAENLCHRCGYARRFG